MSKKTLGILSLVFTIGLGYAGVQAQSNELGRIRAIERYKQIEGLAKNIYFEARDQSTLGHYLTHCINKLNTENMDKLMEVGIIVRERRDLRRSITHIRNSQTVYNTSILRKVG